MAFRSLLSLLLLLPSLFSPTQAQDPTNEAPPSPQSSVPVTVYYIAGQGPQATLHASNSGDDFITALQAYNPSSVIPAPVPAGTAKPGGTYTLHLGAVQAGSGVSIPIEQGFMGFSVEMSVANQVLGKNS
jgi:hypothetical protein